MVYKLQHQYSNKGYMLTPEVIMVKPTLDLNRTL